MYGEVERTASACVRLSEDEANELYDYLSAWAERGRELLPEKMPQIFRDLRLTLADLTNEI